MMIAVVLAGVAVALFVLPHHRGYDSSASLAKDFREFLTAGGQIESPAVAVLTVLVAVGCISVFLPALLAASMLFVPERSTRWVLILGGVALVIGGALTFVVEIFSNMLIGFGSSSRYSETTLVAYLAPLFPFTCGVAAVAMGSGRVRMP